jgi:hypothetical protein
VRRFFDGLLHSPVELLEVGNAHVRPAFAGSDDRGLVRIWLSASGAGTASSSRAQLWSMGQEMPCATRSGRRRGPRETKQRRVCEQADPTGSLQCMNIGLCGSLISEQTHREDALFPPRSTVDALHSSPSNFPGKAAPAAGPQAPKPPRSQRCGLRFDFQ